MLAQYGTVTSALTPLPVSVIISLLFRPQRYDWADVRLPFLFSIPNPILIADISHS